jgi:hypothetical protein
MTLLIYGEQWATDHEAPHYEICPTLPVTSSLKCPNIVVRALLSKTLSLYSSLSLTDQVSHPYITTGKITILYILIFVFFI